MYVFCSLVISLFLSLVISFVIVLFRYVFVYFARSVIYVFRCFVLALFLS